MQAERLHRLGEAGIDDARLEHGAAAGGIDAQDAIHARERDQHRVPVRHGAA